MTKQEKAEAIIVTSVLLFSALFIVAALGTAYLVIAQV
jgi:hypothetical protein